MTKWIMIILALALISSPASAGWLDSVKDGLNTIKSIQGTAPKPQPAREDNGGGSTKKTSAAKEQKKSSVSSDDSEGGSDSDAASGEEEGEVYSNKFDFVAGENVLFFDDFSDTEPGDYPSRWTLGQGGGPVEVVEVQGKRWLSAIADGKGKEMRESHSFMRADLKKSLPEKFTIEFDTPSTSEMCLVFSDAYRGTGRDSVCWKPNHVEMYWVNLRNSNFSESGKPLRHVSIAVSGTNVKVYFDGQRVLLSPDGIRARAQDSKGHISTIGFTFLGGKARKDQRFTNFKLAEGGKDYAKELVSGRIITHGITFDTASDVLKPESGPTLRKIFKLLQDDGALRFEIQGHTDNQGSDKVNGPLSEKRAAAVKDWLVKQGISEARLTAKGLGATKPIDKNDTPEGRANNRRVEFVKL